jgi:hypothetical protein
MKIENQEIWDQIIDGKLKGISIEGFFVDKIQALSKEKDPTDQEVLSALNEIINTKK